MLQRFVPLAALGGLLLPTALSAAAAPPAASCANLRFPVYFADGAASVSGAAGLVLSEAADQIAGCKVREILLTPEGAASEPDGPDALAQARALAVTQALAAAGIDRSLIRTAPHPTAGPQAHIPPRVTVQVRIGPLNGQTDPGAGRFLA